MSLVLRNVKGSKLTISESDGNLTYLEGLINSGGSGGGLVQLIGTGSIDLSLVPVEQGQSLLYGGWFGTFSSGEVLYNYDTNSDPDVLIGSASISIVYKHGEINDEKGSGLTYSYGYLLLENVVGTMSEVSKGVWSTDNPYTNESVNFLPVDNPLDINYSTQTAIEQEISIVEGDWIITQVLLINPELNNLDNTLISTGNVSPYDSCLDTFVFANNNNGSVLRMNNANDFFLRTLYLPDFPGNQSFNIKPTITSNAVIFSVFVDGAIIPSGMVDVVIYGFQKPFRKIFPRLYKPNQQGIRLIVNDITCLENDEYIYKVNFLFRPTSASGNYKLQVNLDGSWEDLKTFSGPTSSIFYNQQTAKFSNLQFGEYSFRIVEQSPGLVSNTAIGFIPICHIAGLYVNDFNTIITSTTEQIDLLSFASNNGISTLYLYDLTSIISNGEQKSFLKQFNVLAKNNGIVKMGGISGSENRTIGTLPNSYSRLQFNNESSGNQKFDIFNLENEFWNYPNTDTTTFSTYTTWLTNITNTLSSTTTDFDVYIGNIDDPTSGYTEEQIAYDLVLKLDRIMYAMYITSEQFASPAWGLNYIDEKLQYLANAANSLSKVIDIVIIFHGGESYMHNYFESHSFEEAYSNVVYSYQNWLEINNKSNIRLAGYFIYAYQQVKDII